MGQPTFASDVPLTPTVRILTADECAENWNALYGCIGMWAEEYWNGSAWVRQFHIKGSGAPSTTYDAFKTIGSEYLNYDYGYKYDCVKDDAGSLIWMCRMFGGRTTAAGTNAHSPAGQGAIVLITDAGAVYIKSEEEGTDESVTIS